MVKNPLIYLVLLFSIHLTLAQPSFKITLLEGTAKAQRAQKKSWESTYLGDEINDNDIVETYFQTKVVFHYGVDNSIILGSNTRCLFNIKEVPQGDVKIINVNLTLFSGGVLVKSVTSSHVNIYTSNAVAQIDSGTISTVVEAKTGHTGFQVLGGTTEARNVAQQQGKKLNPGLTTIVLPGKEPTAPLYITYRHVAVLKHFFGDEFIDQQIEDAGIKPTEDKTSVSRLSLSEGMQGKAEKEEQMQKRLFSQNKIWGIILDDRAKKKKPFQPIEKPLRTHKGKGEIEFNSNIGIAGGTVYPKFCLVPSLHLPKFSIGLNLPYAKNASGAMSLNIGSLPGIFDKIHHITAGNTENARYFKLGPITDYTLGKGLVVNGYQNKNIYTVTQPLGITMQYKNELIDANAFVSDISNWYVGGAHFGFTIGNTWLGCGYYYDANQYNGTLTTETSRFIDIDALEDLNGKLPDSDSVPSNNHIYEVNFGFWQQVMEDFLLDVHFQFAQKIAQDGFDGYVIRGPEVGITLKNFNFGLSYIVDKGRLLEGHLSSMYMSNRLRYEQIEADTVFYWTQNNMLSKDRKSYGFVLFFRASPFTGTAVDLSFRQDFLTRTPFTVNTGDGSVGTDSTSKKNNFTFSLSLRMNERLFDPIKYAEIYLNQTHGGFYPIGGKYLASWGFNTGFDVLTAPLFFNLAFEAGLNFTYIDLYDAGLNFGFPNNNIESGDNLLEFFVGIRWGFL